MMKCPLCDKTFPDDMRFCEECSEREDRLVKLEKMPETPSPQDGLSMGDKNVIAGDVVGHHEEVQVAGNATFIQNQDETKQLRTCYVSGKTANVLDGHVCPKCNQWVCAEYYDTALMICDTCKKSSARQAEETYRSKLEEVFEDHRLELGEREELERLAKSLGLSSDRARELEKNFKAKLSSQIDTMGRREQRRFDAAKKILLDDYNPSEALEILSPIYAAYSDNSEVHHLYLLALSKMDAEKALGVIQSVKFDDLNTSLIHMSLLSESGKYDEAYKVLKQAQLAFGAEQPFLVAKDAEMSLDEFRSTNQAFCLEDAEELVESLPQDSQEPYIQFVIDYLDYCKGDASSLEEGASEQQSKGKNSFYHYAKLKSLPQESSFDVARAFDELLNADRLEDSGREGVLKEWLYENAPLWIDDCKLEAMAGDDRAQVIYGLCFEIGVCVEEDPVSAAKWYKEAAQKGNAIGQQNYAILLSDGTGVGKNSAEAVKWFKMAAEQGRADAQNSFGVMLEEGEGIEKNVTVAVEWYRKAAEQGYRSAQFNYGWALSNGEGIAKDETQAAEWYRKAAEQGHASAQNSLGLILCDGLGVLKDLIQGIDWLRKAALQGNAVAQYNLGLMFDEELGDAAQAVEWYKKAAEQGHDKAIEKLKALSQNESVSTRVEQAPQSPTAQDKAVVLPESKSSPGVTPAPTAPEQIASNEITLPQQLAIIYSDPSHVGGRLTIRNDQDRIIEIHYLPNADNESIEIRTESSLYKLSFFKPLSNPEIGVLNNYHAYLELTKEDLHQAIKNGLYVKYTQDSKSIRGEKTIDVENVFWDGSNSLHCLVSDEVIEVDSDGLYKYWYSSNEDVSVNYRETSNPRFLFYKFKTLEHCTHWVECRNSGGSIRSTYGSNSSGVTPAPTAPPPPQAAPPAPPPLPPTPEPAPTITFAEALLTAVKKTFDVYTSDRIHVINHIPAKLLKNATAKFGLPHDEEVILLFDTTAFKSAKTGFAMLPSGIYMRNDYGGEMSGKYHMDWKEVVDFTPVYKEKQTELMIGPKFSLNVVCMTDDVDCFSFLLENLYGMLPNVSTRAEAESSSGTIYCGKCGAPRTSGDFCGECGHRD